MMLSAVRIKSLQFLLKEQTGKDYTYDEAHDAGMAIMRFTIAKAQRKQELLKLRGNGNGQSIRTTNITA